MSSTLFRRHSRAAATEDEVVLSQEEIEREIAKLREDSARDVQRQLEQQRSAAMKGELEEHVKKAAEHVGKHLSPVWKAAEHVIEDAEAEVKEVREHQKYVESRGRATRVERTNLEEAGDESGAQW